MTLRNKIAIAGGTLAILGGMTGVAFAQSDSVITRNVSNAGILTALSGLLAVLGTQIHPIMKIYLDNQRLQFDVQTAANQAYSERHMIIERVLYTEARVNVLYQQLMPDEPTPKPPDLPPERISFPEMTKKL